MENNSIAITILSDAEAVLMTRVSRMREGKPRSAAQDKIREVRKAIKILQNEAVQHQRGDLD